MVSSTPAGSGLPIGLMPGALPSDHASRQTLNTTAIRLPFGHSQFGLFFILGPGRGTRSEPVKSQEGSPRREQDQARCGRGLINQVPATTRSESKAGATASARLAAATAAVAAQPIEEN